LMSYRSIKNSDINTFSLHDALPIFQFRFKEGILKGQNFGNLFIAAMNEIYGSFEIAIKEASNVLAVTGKVLPMTLENVTLYALRSEEHTSELQSRENFVCRLLLEKK